MADHMGFSDAGSYGTEIATPNIDRLAQDGLRFTQFYNVAHTAPHWPLDLARTDYSETYEGREIYPMDGVSLLPIFRGERRQGHEMIFWEHFGACAARDGSWRLVSFDEGEPWKLFTLESDRTELNDLSEQYPERVQAHGRCLAVMGRRSPRASETLIPLPPVRHFYRVVRCVTFSKWQPGAHGFRAPVCSRLRVWSRCRINLSRQRMPLVGSQKRRRGIGTVPTPEDGLRPGSAAAGI